MKHRSYSRPGKIPAGRFTVGQLCYLNGYPMPAITDGARHATKETVR
jgi:hypothetical protein